jgi:hypothetical protein
MKSLGLPNESGNRIAPSGLFTRDVEANKINGVIDVEASESAIVPSVEAPAPDEQFCASSSRKDSEVIQRSNFRLVL